MHPRSRDIHPKRFWQLPSRSARKVTREDNTSCIGKALAFCEKLA